jgi:hypothetical protein
MDIDFHEQFRDHSTVELLKIVKRPDDYQPAAVAAAKDLLQQRTITHQDMLAVDTHFTALETQQQNEKLNAYKQKAADFLEPVLKPGTEVTPAKWLNIFLLIIGLQYLWDFYKTIRYFIWSMDRHYVVFDYVFLLEFISLVYVPIIFYLLFKRKRWGWILVFAENVFIVITTLGQSYIFFRYQDVHGGDTFSFIWPVVIRSFFLFFLWKQEIAQHFNVTPEIKKKTLAWTAAGTVVFVILMTLMFG